MDFLVFHPDTCETQEMAVVEAETPRDALRIFARGVGIFEPVFREWVWSGEMLDRFYRVNGEDTTDPETGDLRFPVEMIEAAFRSNVEEYFEGAPDLADLFVALEEETRTWDSGRDIEATAIRFPIPELVLTSIFLHRWTGMQAIPLEGIRRLTA